MSATAHYAAIMQRLEQLVGLEVTDTVRVDQNNNLVRASYAVLSGGNPEDLDDERESREQDSDSSATYIYKIASVSVTASGARLIAERTAQQMVGFKPAIPGRRCRTIQHTGSEEPIPDYNVKPPMFYAVDEYTLRSDRGSPQPPNI